MTRATPFTSLLVANRGEIALRIMRTAREMGLRTVAVHSEADRDAPHVQAADRAVCIGGAAPAESYLNIPAIIEAARASGAEAVHPGYGFLAENAGFARACAEAGLVFVGPSAQAIETMGDKAAAKAAMEAAGVPVVPGYDGADQSPERLAEEAGKVGFPLMIKAVAGGGGRGMRLVEQAEGFAAALTSAQGEAEAAFGDGRVLLERAIPAPRHVEIQVMADRHGTVIHLGERDCSVQRRHQKLIEEAPSPAVDAELRARMGAVSVEAARAIGYEGAGTFEYLLDAEGNFFFMEMNTRLQVEHPVTEAITGLDLVALQLRVAAGAPLGLTQEDAHLRGHAFEVRLCAEDAAAGFLPQSGRVVDWHPAPDLRSDDALGAGVSVPEFYDSMLAKLVAHGPDRDSARRRLLAGLERTRLLGLRSNQAFLAACLAHPEFAAGGATTGFIEAHRAALLAEDHAGETRAAMLTAAFLRAAPKTGLAPGFSAPLRLARDGRVHAVQVTAGPRGSCDVRCDETRLALRVTARDGMDVSYELDGTAGRARLVRQDGRLWLHQGGRPWDFDDLSFAPEVSAGVASDGVLRAAMNGTVASVTVAEGDTVGVGQTLLVLEAMKMEHAHTAPMAGTVTALHTAPGAQVTARTPLIGIAPEEGSEVG